MNNPQRFRDADELTVSAGSTFDAVRVTVALATGLAMGQLRIRQMDEPPMWSTRSADLMFEGAALEQIREGARQIHARGPYEFRDEFDEAIVELSVTLADDCVVASYHLNESSTDYDELVELVVRHLYEALSSEDGRAG